MRGRCWAQFLTMLLLQKIYISVLLMLIVSCTTKVPKQKDIWFQATYDPGVGGCSLVFYKDSTCLWMAGIASDDKEGKYNIQGSVITLEDIPLETCFKSKKLLLTNINPNNKDLRDSILVQIDSSLRVVDSIHIFTKIH
jgi:hypothetical protein